MKHQKAETRTWPTKYRGLVLICSSQIAYTETDLLDLCGEKQYARIVQILGWKWRNVVNYGEAIAVGRLSSCYAGYLEPSRKDFIEQVSAWEKRTFVLYGASLYLHNYTDVTPIEPFFWKGQQGWKKLSTEEKQKIKLL
jgi:hypothetical protein